MKKPCLVLTHGGAGSKNEYSDGTQKAADVCLAGLKKGVPVLESVCAGIRVLENDGRFNAGMGSRRRDCGSIQMDAACMGSEGSFGAVAVVEGFKNPIDIACAVSKTRWRVLAGRGAARFAEENGFEKFDLESASEKPGNPACDTVGAVAYDGQTFVAGLSTGGTGGSVLGRVGDVPLIGCGLYAGPQGAVAATGHGESITMNLTAYRAYQMIEQGLSPHDILSQVLSWFTDAQDIGLILVSAKGHAGGSNRSMAWSWVESGLEL